MGLAFAESFIHPPMAVFSSMNIKDNIEEQSSYFNEEILALKTIIKGKEGKKLILLDELFKGTNTEDRILFGSRVLNYLTTENNTILVSTHDLELEEHLNSSFVHQSMQCRITIDDYEFLYTIGEQHKNNQLVAHLFRKHGLTNLLTNDEITV